MPPFSPPPTLHATEAQNAQAGGYTYHLGGQLVPVLSVDLEVGQAVYFEHHILLWKSPSLQFGVRPLAGMVKRLIAGMDLLVVEARGPGQVAFSRDSVGQVFPMVLAHGQELHIREHQFLAATANIDYTWELNKGVSNILFGGTGFFIDKFRATGGEGVIWLHGHGNVFEKTLGPGEQFDVEPGGWLYKDPSVAMETNFQGLSAGFLGGMRLACNRFTGPGRVGIQSMSYNVAPSPTEAASTGTVASTAGAAAAAGIFGAIASSLFGGSDRDR
jgi:uncharacterized protein (AIM24 family)